MPEETVRQKVMAAARTVVVKIGSDVLAGARGRRISHDRRVIRDLAQSIAELHERWVKVVLVSSGAIGQGLAQLARSSRPSKMEQLQAAAAIGQPHLMRLYEAALSRHGLRAGQILLTRSDFEERSRYLNIQRTIETLHKLKAVPIVNENDTVAVEEIRFGENDVLAALVANLLQANLLIFLSTVDGLLRDGTVVDTVEEVDQSIYRLDHGGQSRSGAGGMSTKLQAAALVTDAGDAAVIANGKTPRILTRLLDGENLGTLFVPAGRKVRARQRWISSAAKSAGSVTVDAGAAAALRQARRSLLAIGVTSVSGNFRRGQVVEVLNPTGESVARGKVNYSSGQIRKIKGLRSSQIKEVLGKVGQEEIIHADHLALKRN